MQTETCPHCHKSITVPFGKQPCPECKEPINVFDPATRVDRGYSVRTLDAQPAPGRLHEGTAGTRGRGTVTYADVGGMDGTIRKLDLLVNAPYKHPELCKQLGVKPPRGILLSGPSGCGKTLLAQAIANECNRKCVVVQGSAIKGWRVGASEGNLKDAHASVKPNGILIIDELDAIGKKRDRMVNETEASIVSTLLSLMDGAGQRDAVTFIGTTNVPHTLDSALRRPGRFDVEVTIRPPDAAGRLPIFHVHTRGMNINGIDLCALAAAARGYTGADIAHVCHAAAYTALERAVETGEARLTQADFEAAIRGIVPSLIRGSYVQVETVHWDDIGGLHDVKERLRKAVEWPLKYPDLLERAGLRPPKGILFYGLPGCAKTLTAKALATESGYNFLAVSGPALLSMWVGSSEEAVRSLFAQARMVAPAIVFLDEVDCLAAARTASANDVSNRVTGQLLSEMDGISPLEHVLVIGATNRPDMLDPAVLRPGRFDMQIEFPLPDAEARVEILRIHTSGLEVDLAAVAARTDGLSGADLEWLCVRAKQAAVERAIVGEPLRLDPADFI